MAKFINLDNVKPIWYKINDLYIRKGDIESNIKENIYFDLNDLIKDNIEIDISNHEPLDITQSMYMEGEIGNPDEYGNIYAPCLIGFINTPSARKYIIDKKFDSESGEYINGNIYSIIGEFINDNKLTDFDGIEIEEQTNKLLIAFDNCLYFLWGIKLNSKITGGNLGTYKIIQEPFMDKIDRIEDDFINKLKSKYE